MLMSPIKLIFLRLFNITFGNFPVCARFLRKILVKVLIKKAEKKYFASSRYFDWRDLDE